MTVGMDKPENRTVERILRQHGEAMGSGEISEAQGYKAFLTSPGFPLMGFSIFTRDGGRHLFLYHNLENVDMHIGKHGEYLRFTHRGKAVTIRGRGFHAVCDAILEHHLQAVYEFSEAWGEAEPLEGPLVDRVQVDSLEQMDALAARNMEERGRLS